MAAWLAFGGIHSDRHRDCGHDHDATKPSPKPHMLR